MNSDRLYANVVGQRVKLVANRFEIQNPYSFVKAARVRRYYFRRVVVLLFISRRSVARKRDFVYSARIRDKTRLPFAKNPTSANPCARIKRAHAKRRIEMRRRPCTMTRAHEKITFSRRYAARKCDYVIANSVGYTFTCVPLYTACTGCGVRPK